MQARNKGKRLNSYLADYVVFDLETTGINQERDAIIEISAVKVADHKVVGEYSTLVNPGRHIPAATTAVNGITDSMVAAAPDVKAAMQEFLEFIGNSVLVGHNIHTFDTNFIYDAALKHFGIELKNDYVDTLYLARRCLPELSHHKLTDVSEYFHIQTQGAHRALNDCRMNQSCYEQLGKIWQQLEAQKKAGKGKEKEAGQEMCPLCGEELIKRKGRYGYFYGCTGFPGCRYTKNA